MVLCKAIVENSVWGTVQHMNPRSRRHKTDKAFFSEQSGSCPAQPFLRLGRLMAELTSYRLVEINGVQGLMPIPRKDFDKALFAKDQRGRQRTGPLAYKIIVSPSDRVQGFLISVKDPNLAEKLVTRVYWHMLRRLAIELEGMMLAAPHWNTTRFHAEAFFPIYSASGKRLRPGFRYDGPLIAAQAARVAAGFPTPGFQLKHEKMRWNSRLGQELERELTSICRDFYREHHLPLNRAAKCTEWLQTEGRSEVGKKWVRLCESVRKLKADIIRSGAEDPAAQTKVPMARNSPDEMSVHAQPTLDGDCLLTANESAPVPTAHPSIASDLIADLFAISQNETGKKLKLRQPQAWAKIEDCWVWLPDSLGQDDSEDAKEFKKMWERRRRQNEEDRARRRDIRHYPVERD